MQSWTGALRWRRAILPVGFVLAVGLGLSAGSPGTATGAIGAIVGATCASPGHPGGAWPSLNGDLANSRSQSAEQVIGPQQAAKLSPAWSFSGASVGAPGGMRSTPIVAYGCVYIALGEGYLGDRGDVIALNADTGALVWHRKIDGSVLGLTAEHGRVYAAVSQGSRSNVPVVTEETIATGTSAVALDAMSGKLRWASVRLDDGNADNGTFINATPVAFTAGERGLLFVALAGGGGDGARVPMYFLDARSGQVVKKAYSLTEAEYELGYGGTGIWSTAAYDPNTQHLYVGTADSDGHSRQHPYNNAILKVDASPRRAGFGTVVAAYQGVSEHADLDGIIGYPNNPVCGASGELFSVDPPTFVDTSASAECLELDFDFGASPNLFVGRDGRMKVAALQKSGVVHVAYADTMDGDWRRFVGTAGAFMNGATSAVDSSHLYVPATPNLVFKLHRDTGDVAWLSSTEIGLFSYGPVTHANGVIYAVNDAGFLVASDAATGVVLSRSLISSAGQVGQCLGVGSGVAVARNTVYAPCNGGGAPDLAGLPGDPGGIVAYRP
jgi:polyvinyl alcohol dehydrogenase (cytochrome)